MKLTKYIIITKDLEVESGDMYIRFRVQEGALVRIYPVDCNLPYMKGYMHWEFYYKAIKAALKEIGK